MTDKEPVPGGGEEEVDLVESKKKGRPLSSLGVIAWGTICGIVLITTVMPTCSCAGKRTRSEMIERQAAIAEAIRQQSGVPLPEPGHERSATASE